jgi:hypothetical protein
MSKFLLTPLCLLVLSLGMISCSSSSTSTEAEDADDWQSRWDRDDSLRGELAAYEAGEEAADAAEEKGKKKTKKSKKKSKGWNPFRGFGQMAQGGAIIIVLFLGFIVRVWKGSGPIQSGVSITLATVCFGVYWGTFGFFSWATMVALVVTIWEPITWFWKWYKGRPAPASL